jgi:ankyrin repeat protein
MKMKKSMSLVKKILVIVALALILYFVAYAPIYTYLLNHYILVENTAALNIVLSLPGSKNRSNAVALMEYYGSTPMGTAIEFGNLEALRLLIEKEANVNSDRDSYLDTPLGLACGSGHENRLQMEQILVENGADVNIRLEGFHTPLVKTFIHDYWYDRAYGNEMSNGEKEELRKEDQNINYHVMLYLIEHGADLTNPDVEKELMEFVVRDKNIPAISYLLDTGLFDVNGSAEYPGGPLVQAAFSGDIEVAEFLLDHGADPLMTYISGDTVLDYVKNTIARDDVYYSDMKPIAELYETYAIGLR